MDLVIWRDVTVLLSLWQCIEDLVAAKEWTYAGTAGQSEWPVLFPDCGGSSQSPIYVDTSKTIYDPSLPRLRLLGYEQYGHVPFTLSNNGHTVVMPLPSWMGLSGLPWQFSAVQLHLHWGNGVGVAKGSEHSIDEQSASAELHVVHYNSELYSNFTEAKTQENGLAVFAVLIKEGEKTNQAYANIFNYLNRIRYSGQKVLIPAFDVGTLLPRDLDQYFRYSGSLTTPPCHQSVLWTVFVEKVKISHSQLHVVHYNSELYSNFTEAKTQENGLAVFAVLIKEGEKTNQAYANIFNYLNRIRYSGQKVLIPAFDVGTLLPRDLDQYFRYSGSLTTPPCHQSVLWTVFVEKVKISHSQLMKLETVLYSSRPGSNPKPLQNNYRTTQPLNNRTVLSSFIPGEISAIVLGCLCGCVGLAAIVFFIIRTIQPGVFN